MIKPVLITGGAGSVGRQLAGMLLADGIPVRVFDLPAFLGHVVWCVTSLRLHDCRFRHYFHEVRHGA